MSSGGHDSDCERDEQFFICHCSKRRRELSGKTELPQLWIAFPTCSGCGEATYHDGDTLHCDRCHVAWTMNANDGDRAERFTDDYGDISRCAEHGIRAHWICQE